MNEIEIDREIRKTLVDIFSYLNIDTKHSDDATVRTYLEWLIERVK
jgi:hypothetical protein